MLVCSHKSRLLPLLYRLALGPSVPCPIIWAKECTFAPDGVSHFPGGVCSTNHALRMAWNNPPQNTRMVIKTAEFIKSSARVDQCPEGHLPEYAFIGRSNVGKSSLINMLTGFGGLAMTSSKPGKTQLINHFLINKQWHLVDLPGYGYAVRDKSQRLEFRRMIEQYILEREQLVNLFILVDSRLEPQKIDLEFIQQMGEAGVPLSIIMTKIDKLSFSKLKESKERYQKVLAEEWEELPPFFFTSSEKNEGRDELLQYIESINQTL